MDKNELKKILKPLIKECIKEVMFETGVLSKVVSEVTNGLTENRQVLAESSPAPERQHVEAARNEQSQAVNKKLQEYKKSFAEKISADNYGGVDLFEGTEPLKSGGTPNTGPKMGPMANVDPDDEGVNIDGLMKVAGGVWNKLANSR